MSPDDAVRTRRDDGPIYRWLPAIVTVVTVGVAWGTLTANVGRLDSAAAESNSERRLLRDQSIRLEAQLERLNEALAENKVAAALVTELAETVGRLDGKIERNWVNVDHLWEVTRENQANIDIVADQIRASGGTILLQRRSR